MEKQPHNITSSRPVPATTSAATAALTIAGITTSHGTNVSALAGSKGNKSAATALEALRTADISGSAIEPIAIKLPILQPARMPIGMIPLVQVPAVEDPDICHDPGIARPRQQAIVTKVHPDVVVLVPVGAGIIGNIHGNIRIFEKHLAPRVSHLHLRDSIHDDDLAAASRGRAANKSRGQMDHPCERVDVPAQMLLDILTAIHDRGGAPSVVADHLPIPSGLGCPLDTAVSMGKIIMPMLFVGPTPRDTPCAQ